MVYFVVFIAAACLSATTDPHPNTNLPQTCLANPFSSSLSRNLVKLFDQPRTSENNRCGQEWQHFGVCCNEAQLIRFAKEDQSNVSRSVKNVLKSFGEILDSFDSARNKSLEIKLHQFEYLNMMTHPLLEFLRDKSARTFSTMLQDLIKNQNLTPDLTRCWDHISKARSSSLCSVCSGRGQTFFSGGKILMLATDCSDIIEKCAPSFKNLVNIVDLLAKYLISFEQAAEGSYAGIRAELSYLKKLTVQIEAQHIHPLIEMYSSSPAKYKPRIAAMLCSMLVNIRGDSFIEKLDKILQNFKFYTLENLMIKSKNKVSNYVAGNSKNRGSQRILAPSETPILSKNQALEPKFSQTPINYPPLEFLFQGDVAIVQMNTDSSYTSYHGAKGTTVASHWSGQPFNITSIFP